MKILIIALTVVLHSFTFAQSYSASEIDSIFAAYLHIKAPHLLATQDIPQMENTLPIKCGLETVNFVRMNAHLFDLEKQQIINSIAQRVPKQTSIVSPGGFFRIHFNTAGDTIPKYNPSLSAAQNAFLIAEALDSSYNFEVNFLGFPAPPSDGSSGGDNLYDVYIEELGSGLYGYTEQEIQTAPNSTRWTSFIVIDNDYVGSFATHGIDAARVTVAHEFHHAIQMGNYTFRTSDIFFYELTSTAMEEFVYDTVNDYYAYMSSYFNNPGLSFSRQTGYNLAIWNIFLKDRFGFDIIKRQWELMTQMRALDAIAASLVEYDASLRTEFNKFGVWTYFTGSRRVPGEYFKEAQNYPLLRISTTINFNPPSVVVNGNSNPVANNFYNILNSNVSPTDSFVVLNSNSDFARGISSPAVTVPYTYSLFSDSVEHSVQIDSGYFALFNPIDSNNWAVSEFLNRQLIREDSSVYTLPDDTVIIEVLVFPNPFVYGNASHTNIYFTVSEAIGVELDLNVYTSAMELVYESKKPVTSYSSYKVIEWNGRSENGERVSSGVYIYAIKSGDEIRKGKLVIFND